MNVQRGMVMKQLCTTTIVDHHVGVCEGDWIGVRRRRRRALLEMRISPRFVVKHVGL